MTTLRSSVPPTRTVSPQLRQPQALPLCLTQTSELSHSGIPFYFDLSSTSRLSHLSLTTVSPWRLLSSKAKIRHSPTLPPCEEHLANIVGRSQKYNPTLPPSLFLELVDGSGGRGRNRKPRVRQSFWPHWFMPPLKVADLALTFRVQFASLLFIQQRVDKRVPPQNIFPFCTVNCLLPTQKQAPKHRLCSVLFRFLLQKGSGGRAAGRFRTHLLPASTPPSPHCRSLATPERLDRPASCPDGSRHREQPAQPELYSVAFTIRFPFHSAFRSLLKALFAPSFPTTEQAPFRKA